MKDLYIPNCIIRFYNLFSKKKIQRKIVISRHLLSEFFIPQKLRADYYILDKIAYEFTHIPLALKGSINCKVRTPEDPPLLETGTLPPGYILSCVRHLLRYKFLELLSYRKKVLDCACGCGYGTYILARSAKEVVGIDLDCQAIEFANKYHKTERTRFYNMSIEKYQEGGGNDFDVAVSVETLEHIPPDKVDSFISSLMSSVKPDGLIILTTPRVDKTITYTRDAGEYHSHFREYSKDDFLGMLIRNKLKIKQYLLQSFDGSIIYQIPKKTKFPHATTLDSYVQIAVCSKHERI